MSNMQFKYEVERFRRKFLRRRQLHGQYIEVKEFQRLVGVRRAFGGLIEFRKTIDVEEIPEHVLISLGCFGDTGGWISRFAEYIDRSAKRSKGKIFVVRL